VHPSLVIINAKNEVPCVRETFSGRSDPVDLSAWCERGGKSLLFRAPRAVVA
jgi:hypothetical protein